MSGDIGPKYLELLMTLVPKLSRVAVLVNPANSVTRVEFKNMEAANKRAGLKLTALEADTPEKIDRAIAEMVKQRIEGAIVTNDAFFGQQRSQIAGLALKNRIPCLGSSAMYADAGFLISYGGKAGESFRRAASYVDRIAKGAKPGDLPIEQPMVVEMVINMKTAKSLGLKIPNTILVSAERVIE
jgi:putative ABC transport system substrate-binding protein